MPKKAGKKRKKKQKEDAAEEGEGEGSETSLSETESMDEHENMYKPFFIADYTRIYAEDSRQFEYIVFFESSDANKPIGDRDMMALANIMKRFNKGVKQLQRINKYKIGAIFERPGLANQALTNKKFLDHNKLKASIPAAATETTGVIQHVPTHLSNEQIYNNLTSTKNIISIRRFMRKTKSEDGSIHLQPTKTVSITFSCPILPESVDLNSWLFEVRQYIPPVKQCLRCLRYGHIAKYCKNSERCSICGGSHCYKDCITDTKDAMCVHCNGNHIAISSSCPVKQAKINENKNKVTANTKTYAEMLEKSYPSLSKTKLNPFEQFKVLLNSDQVLTLIVESFAKIMANQKTNQKPICTESIKETLIETLKTKQFSHFIFHMKNVIGGF